MRDGRPSRHRAAGASLESALRDLPRPSVPEGLCERLVAAIRPPAAPRRWPAPTMAVAAALLVVGLALRPGPEPTRARPKPRPSAAADTSPSFILEPALARSTEETRPCDVLPPLPSL